MPKNLFKKNGKGYYNHLGFILESGYSKQYGDCWMMSYNGHTYLSFNIDGEEAAEDIMDQIYEGK